MHYDRFKMDMYSNNGEDGVLWRIMYELQIQPSESWCVDVGAYDGIAYSNTYRLVQQNSNAVLIEPSLVGGLCEKKYEALKTMPDFHPKVLPLRYAVVPSNYSEEQKEEIVNIITEGDTNCGTTTSTLLEAKDLDTILSETDIPEDYDILNIDTDTIDHDIWKDHKKYRPKIVVMEINSSIEPDLMSHTSEGVSFSQSMKVAEEMGYSAVSHTGNVIYVRNDLLDKLSINENHINKIDILFNRRWL